MSIIQKMIGFLIRIIPASIAPHESSIKNSSRYINALARCEKWAALGQTATHLPCSTQSRKPVFTIGMGRALTPEAKGCVYEDKSYGSKILSITDLFQMQ